jgi:hypothetical protein
MGWLAIKNTQNPKPTTTIDWKNMHGTLLEMGFMAIPPFPPYLFKPQKVMMLWQKWNHKRL